MILIVEDDKSLSMVMKLSFDLKGIKAVVANSREEAASLFKQYCVNLHGVVVDAYIPTDSCHPALNERRPNSAELISSMRNSDFSGKIIGISGYDGPEIQEYFMDAGADDFIVKNGSPFMGNVLNALDIQTGLA